MSDAATGLTTSAAHDAVAGTSPSSPPSRGTPLADFPADATLRVWRKPSTGVEPVDGGPVHVSELIPNNGDFILICFESMVPSAWGTARELLQTGMKIARPLLVGAFYDNEKKSALYGVVEEAGFHGLTDKPNHSTIFVPSPTLMRLLKIDHGSRTRNALFLIRNGRVCTEWISGGDGNWTHDWATILIPID